VWDADEAQAFLTAAKAAGPQMSAFCRAGARLGRTEGRVARSAVERSRSGEGNRDLRPPAHESGGEDSGLPLLTNNFGQRASARVINAAKVRPITVHGLRHTLATLLLRAEVAPHVVQRRLGHTRIEITLGTYAHCLPSMQQEASRRLGSLLYSESVINS
jgi:integrase